MSCTGIAGALADIVAALPKGMVFLEWYGNPDESDFVGTREVKSAARSAWDYLQGVGDGLGLTVRDLLDAEEIDYGPDPDDVVPGDIVDIVYRCGCSWVGGDPDIRRGQPPTCPACWHHDHKRVEVYDERVFIPPSLRARRRSA